MNTHRRWVGLGLISFPLLLQVPFTMLTATFDYPAILEREASEVYVDSPEARPMISIAYIVQHRLFGAMLGEFVGQLTLAVWTGLISSAIASAWLKRLGYFTAAAFLLGLGHEAHPALRHLPMIAFIAWSVFAVWLGASLTRRKSPRRAAASDVDVPR